MKKTATILMGLALSVSALAACGSKKDSHVIPERDEFGYKIEFEKTYTGRDELNCRKNTTNQLESENLVNMKGSMKRYERISNYVYQESIEEGKFDIYANGVLDIENTSTSTFSVGGIKYKSQDVMKEEVVFLENQYIEIGTEVSDDNYFYYDIDTYGWDNRKDYSAYLEVSGIATMGQFGVDKNGNGYMYYNDITEHTEPGYNSYGVAIEVYTYEIEETLIAFEGDPLTSKPWKIVFMQTEIQYFDDLHIQTKEGTLVRSQSIEYYPTYGKRKEYKNKEALIEKACEETISECPDVSLAVFNGVTVDANKNLTVLPTSYNSYSSNVTPDIDLKNLKKLTGFGVDDTAYLEGDDAIAFNFEFDTVFASYDKTAKLYYDGSNSFDVFTKIKCDNLPEGLSIVKDEYGNEYIYSEIDYGYIAFEYDFTLTLQKVAEVTVPQVEVVVTIVE